MYSDTYIPQFLKRWVRGDNRDEMIQKINRVVIKAISIIKQTGAVVAVETGVTEWYTESLVSSAPHTECFVPDPIASSDWASDMGNIDREYKSVFPLPAFPETEEAMLRRRRQEHRKAARRQGPSAGFPCALPAQRNSPKYERKPPLGNFKARRASLILN